MTDYTGNPVPPAYDPSASAAPGTNPGRTFGIVGLILGIVGFFVLFLAPIAGLILSIIGRNRSKRVGMKNGVAVAGIIVSIVALIANIIFIAVVVSLGAAIGGTVLDTVQQCQNDPTGSVVVQGQQISCDEILGNN